MWQFLAKSRLMLHIFLKFHPILKQFLATILLARTQFFEKNYLNQRDDWKLKLLSINKPLIQYLPITN